MMTIREPAVAGTFYPANPETLEKHVRAFLEEANPVSIKHFPKAFILPHAGYVYSGETAAAAYASLKPYATQIKRVVLVGPAHRARVRGIALPDVDAFETPLGTVEVDRQAIAKLQELKQAHPNFTAHKEEHALEVQLPFLQTVLNQFTIVPLLVGNATAKEVSEVLEQLWGGDETLILISSDLSHFLTYEDARTIDQDTIVRIMRMESLDSYHQACGALPINGLLLAAQRHHLHPQLIAFCNSGDTAGDKNRVVGYASFAFTEEDDHARIS